MEVSQWLAASFVSNAHISLAAAGAVGIGLLFYSIANYARQWKFWHPGEKKEESKNSPADPVVEVVSGQPQGDSVTRGAPPRDERSLVRSGWELTPLAVAEIGLVLAAIVAAVYYCQLRSMQQSVRLTRLALDADVRPWVSLEYGKTQLIGSLPVIQEVTIKNIGKYPLLKLRAHLAMELVPNGTVPQFDWNRKHMESKVPILLPASPTVLPAELGDANDTRHIVSQAEIDNLKAGQVVLITYARIAYDDTLGVGHWQQFCNWLNFSGIDQLDQTVTQTKCAEFNDTEKNRK